MYLFHPIFSKHRTAIFEAFFFNLGMQQKRVEINKLHWIIRIIYTED